MASIRQIFRTDKVFAGVLVLVGLELVHSALIGSAWGLFSSGIILWGLLTFRWWGLLLACVCSGLGLLYGLGLFLYAPSKDGGVASAIGVIIASNAYLLIVLLVRRGHFD